jgi:nitronate monooxygenase
MNQLAPAIYTKLSRRLGVRYPLMCAPMFIISNVEMLVACAQAGILGVMPSINARTHDAFRLMLAELQKRCTGPYAINLTIGLSDPERLRVDVEACIEYKVPVLVTSYGDPSQIVAQAHQHDILVFHDVIHLKHALKAQTAGVDGIIAVTAGAGGHGGTLSPFALIPWFVKELQSPIIAAGCISQGKHIMASLALGADLCYIGTRFIASQECAASTAYKDLVVHATPDDIVYTDQVSGVHANFLRQTLPQDGLYSRENPHKKWKDIWSAGQGVAQIDHILSIEMIVQEMMQDFHRTRDQIQKL